MQGVIGVTQVTQLTSGDTAIYCDCGAQKVRGWGRMGEYDCPICYEREASRRETAERETARIKAERRGIDRKFWDADLANCDDSNAAVAGVKAWTANPTGFIFVFGKCGRGKTYLASAAKKEFNRRGIESRYTSEEELFLEIKSTFGAGAAETESGVYRKYTAQSPLIIDDVGTLRVTDTTFDIWEHIIGRRYRNCAPTLITSNYGLDVTDGINTRIGVRATERIREYGMVFEYVGRNRRDVMEGNKE